MKILNLKAFRFELKNQSAIENHCPNSPTLIEGVRMKLKAKSLRNRIKNFIFSSVHKSNLVYNTCWEDPNVDRQALDLSAKDKLLVITSAGCNALDYLLAGCGEVHAVDVNPIQNALLELKRSCILNLEYHEFFGFFGNGQTPEAAHIYKSKLRKDLSQFARKYWDKNIRFFNGKGWRKSFYHRGTSGLLAKIILTHATTIAGLKEPIQKLLEANTIEEQTSVYEKSIKPRIWTKWLKWFLSRNFTLNLMGVPEAQKEQITRQYSGGIAQYIQDSIEFVITRLPFKENYFYRVYLEGKYGTECCPEYLREENFILLKQKINNLHIHTNTITEHLLASTGNYTKFVLLDHMDWMSNHDPEGLANEWNAILEKSAPNSQIIFRSAAIKVDYLNNLEVFYKGSKRKLGDMLDFDIALANNLHQLDRVHTYASFHIASIHGTK